MEEGNDSRKCSQADLSQLDDGDGHERHRKALHSNTNSLWLGFSERTAGRRRARRRRRARLALCGADAALELVEALLRDTLLARSRLARLDRALRAVGDLRARGGNGGSA